VFAVHQAHAEPKKQDNTIIIYYCINQYVLSKHTYTEQHAANKSQARNDTIRKQMSQINIY